MMDEEDRGQNEMSDKSLISIIVPIFNAEKYIDICVKSLVDQTYKCIEIILVDDCSGDRSLALCRAWSERDDRVKVFSLKKNSGPSAARNKGMSEAHGEYITFVDSDDWIEKKCVEEALLSLEKSDADVVVWNLVDHYGENEVLENALEGDKRLFSGKEIAHLQEMLLTLKTETGTSSIGLTGPFCKLFSTKVVREAYFPEKISLGEDVCFVLQAFNKCNYILYVNKAYYHRINYGSSLSHKSDKNFAIRRADYVNWVLEYCGKENIVGAEILNQFIYVMLKDVVQHHMHVTHILHARDERQKAKEYLKRISVPVDWDKVKEKNKRKKRYLKKEWYWRYKVYFVFTNVLHRFSEKIFQ